VISHFQKITELLFYRKWIKRIPRQISLVGLDKNKGAYI